MKRKNVASFSKHIGKAYHISQRYHYKWINNIASSVLNETYKFKENLLSHKLKEQDQEGDEMFECTENDDVGTTSFLAHTIEISDVRNILRVFFKWICFSETWNFNFFLQIKYKQKYFKNTNLYTINQSLFIKIDFINYTIKSSDINN